MTHKNINPPSEYCDNIRIELSINSRDNHTSLQIKNSGNLTIDGIEIYELTPNNVKGLKSYISPIYSKNVIEHNLTITDESYDIIVRPKYISEKYGIIACNNERWSKEIKYEK